MRVTRDISVIVVVKNEEKTIADCLESLLAQDFPRDRYEVTVVDGASLDRTCEICEKYPVKLIRLDRPGISYQRNIGIEATEGRYVAFTDADCVVERKWLRKLIEQIESRDKTVAAVGGPNLVFDSDPPLSKIIGYAQETLLGSGGSPQSYRISNPSYVYSIPNCNILYRREVIAQERYDNNFSVGEDAELNFRLRQKEYRLLYLPDIIVWHHRPGTIKDFVKKMFHYGEAMARITRKHKKIVRWYAFVAGLAVLAVIFSYPIFFLFHPVSYIYAIAVLVYVVALAWSTVQVHRRYKSIKSALTMILLPMQHFLYGVGFIKGLLELKRG